MKLKRVGPVGRERAAIVVDGQTYDVSGFGQDYDESFFEESGPERLQAWVKKQGKLPVIDDAERVGPCIRRPSKIVCVGLNYRAHATETGAEIPKEPVLFFKSTTALNGPNDDVVLPRASEKTDWEVELAVIIGRRARYVSPDDALSYVAGFALHNDYSEREHQLERGGQWVKGKSADTFAPLGPVLVTSDELSWRGLSMWLRVNGQERQRGNTADMIFGVPELVAYISEFMTLLPGDVISTGTPPGVGLGHQPPLYLKAGDTVELAIEGLGEARQRIVREPAA